MVWPGWSRLDSPRAPTAPDSGHRSGCRSGSPRRVPSVRTTVSSAENSTRTVASGLERDVLDLADLHAGDAHEVALLQPADVGELRVVGLASSKRNCAKTDQQRECSEQRTPPRRRRGATRAAGRLSWLYSSAFVGRWRWSAGAGGPGSAGGSPGHSGVPPGPYIGAPYGGAPGYGIGPGAGPGPALPDARAARELPGSPGR